MYVIKEYRTEKKVASFQSETSALAFMKGCCTNYLGEEWKIGNEAFLDGKRVYVQEYVEIRPTTLGENVDRDREIIERFFERYFRKKGVIPCRTHRDFSKR